MRRYWNGKIYVQPKATTGQHVPDLRHRHQLVVTGATATGLRQGYGCAAGAGNNKMYMIGGDAAPQTTLSVYDIATNTWSTGASAPEGVFLSG